MMSPCIPLIRAEKYYMSSIPINRESETLPQTLPSYVGAESFDWVLCYSDDIYKHWRRIEQKCMIIKSYPNMHIIRPLLINIMRDLQKNYGLANTTLHLAVYILDNFLSRNSQNVEMKLMVITALIVAAKVEDLDLRIPRFAELNQTVLSSGYTLKDYRKLETEMLICMDFKLTMPTVATFANYFSRISVVLEDFHIHQQQQIFEINYAKQMQSLREPITNERIMYVLFDRYDEMLTAVNKMLQRLIDYNLENTSLINILPSRKAAGCIAAARQLFNIQPVWTPFLEMQISYSESEVRPIMEEIIAVYDIRVSNESSYESSPQTDDDVDDESSSTGTASSPSSNQMDNNIFQSSIAQL